MRWFWCAFYLFLAAANLSAALRQYHTGQYGWMLFSAILGIWMFMNSVAKAQESDDEDDVDKE